MESISQPIPRFIGIGLGDSGGEALLSAAQEYTGPAEEISYVFLNTNQMSLDQHTAALPGSTQILLGKETLPDANGASKNPERGKAATLETIKTGEILTACKGAEAAVVCGSLGIPGTGTGGFRPLVEHLRNDLHLFTVPVVSVDGIETFNIDVRRAAYVQAELKALDDQGVPMVEASVVKLMETFPNLTAEEAFALQGRRTGRIAGTIANVIADPRGSCDRSDLDGLLYVNEPKKPRRWLVSTAELPVEATAEQINSAVAELFFNPCYEFDYSLVGGAVLAVKGRLINSVRKPLQSQIRVKVDELHAEKKQKKESSEHFLPITTFLPDEGNSGVLKLMLWMAMYTGESKGLSKICWRPKSYTRSTAAPAPSAKSQQQFVAPAPVVKPPAPPEPKPAPAAPQKLASNAVAPTHLSFGKLTEMMNSWERGKHSAIERLLIEGHPKFVTDPDTAKDDAVVLSMIPHGADWAADISASLPSISKLLIQYNRGHKTSLSESWVTIFSDGLAVYKGQIPRSIKSGVIGSQPIDYTKSISEISSLHFWGKMDDTQKDLIRLGARIAQVLGPNVLEDFLEPEGPSLMSRIKQAGKRVGPHAEGRTQYSQANAGIGNVPVTETGFIPQEAGIEANAARAVEGAQQNGGGEIPPASTNVQ